MRLGLRVPLHRVSVWWGYLRHPYKPLHTESGLMPYLKTFSVVSPQAGVIMGACFEGPGTAGCGQARVIVPLK